MAENGPSVGSTPSLLKRAWWLFEVLNVRLRFIFLMIIVGMLVGYWDTLMNYVDRWTRPDVERNLEVARNSYRVGRELGTIFPQIEEEVVMIRLNALAFVPTILVKRAELEGREPAHRGRANSARCVA